MKNEVELIKCQKCKNGYLGMMDKQERARLSLEKGRHIPYGTLGCDECQYFE